MQVPCLTLDLWSQNRWSGARNLHLVNSPGEFSREQSLRCPLSGWLFCPLLKFMQHVMQSQDLGPRRE